MKLFYISVFFVIGTLSNVYAQVHHPFGIDTILFQNFEADTFDLPASAPVGDDIVWVNYDEDGAPQICFDPNDTYGWFPYEDINDTSNYTYTSCSYNRTGTALCPGDSKNRNWLIMPPVMVTEPLTYLDWESLSMLGPFLMDGYKVLVSTTDNLPDSFTDTLFLAAEATALNPSPSLNPNAHTYSPGYVHAKKYTMTQYFQQTTANGLTYLQGKLEPHSVSLEKYLGKKIYIAFLHDAYCDFILQIDDILVVKKEVSAASEPIFKSDLGVFPNPAQDFAFVEITASTPAKAQLRCVNSQGQAVSSSLVLLQGGMNRLPVDVQNLPDGLYQVELQTENQRVAGRLVVAH
jgi:Secretion system C-terminal sorting domain